MNTLLAYIQFIFIGLVIYGSILNFGNISINTSMSGIVAPILAWFAGTGLRASFNSENNNQNNKPKALDNIFSSIKIDTSKIRM